MSNLELGPNDALYYAYHPPEGNSGCTFVFFNALTADTSAWESVIGLRMRSAGHGTLAYSFIQGVESSMLGYIVRLLGGIIFVVGMLIMAVNVWLTIVNADESSSDSVPSAA